jgi:hypothetical protein
MARVSEIAEIKQVRDVCLTLSDTEQETLTSDNLRRFNLAADRILGWAVRRVDSQTVQTPELVVGSEGEIQPNISLGLIAMRTREGEVFGLGTEWYFQGDYLLDEDLGPVEGVYTVPGTNRVAGNQLLAAQRLSDLENSIEAYAQAHADQPAIG